MLYLFPFLLISLLKVTSVKSAPEPIHPCFQGNDSYLFPAHQQLPVVEQQDA